MGILDLVDARFVLTIPVCWHSYLFLLLLLTFVAKTGSSGLGHTTLDPRWVSGTADFLRKAVWGRIRVAGTKGVFDREGMTSGI